MQAYDARFVRNVENYTQGVWTPGSIIASNSNTLDYGWNYDFDTQTGKGGETYIVQFTPEERTQHYYEDGEIKEESIIERTIDGTKPKNILAIFAYIFQRIWNEPVEYEPEYQEYTPNYMENPIAPTKGNYLNKLDKMDLIDIPEKTDPEPSPDPKPIPSSAPTPSPRPEPSPVPPVEPEPIIIPAVVPEPTPIPVIAEPVPQAMQIVTSIVAEEIESEPVAEAESGIIELEEPEVPLVVPEGNWALINLITTILSVIIAFGMLLTGLFKKSYEKDNDEEEDEDEGKHKASKIFGILPAALSILLFLMTEDIRLPMVLVDKWTLPMIIILIISVILAYLTKNKKKEKDEEEEEF